jgi:hypothetical protein
MIVRRGAPIARAASTYGSSLTLITWFLTTRKYCGMYTTVIAAAAVKTPWPSVSESRNAITIASSR